MTAFIFYKLTWINKETVKNIFKVQDDKVIKHRTEKESDITPKIHALHQYMFCLLIFPLHVPKYMSLGIRPVLLNSDLPVILHANPYT